jgi:diacylglycerol kinase (ATP)
VKWLAVVNRAAGRAHEAEALLAALEQLPELSAVVVYTDGPGSGTQIARDAAEFDGLIVVGGDGTISECLSGMDLPRQRLAIVPAGHGNCLGRDLGLCRPRDAIEALRRLQCRVLDLMDVTVRTDHGAATRRLCASTLAVGYVTDVVTVGRRRLPGLGHAAYAVAAVFTVPRKFRARHDGEDWVPYTGIVVNNTRHLANFDAFPQARLDDGLLDVMLQRCGWPRQQLHNCSVLVGSAAFGPLMLRQLPRAGFQIDSPCTLMADGELLPGVTGVSVECRRAAVTCVARPQ